MGATIEIAARSAEEFKALESEGAPSIHLTYGSTSRLLSCFGLEFDGDNYVGTIDPQDVLSAATTAQERAALDLYDSEVLGQRVALLVEMAGMAARIGRDLCYA